MDLMKDSGLLKCVKSLEKAMKTTECMENMSCNTELPAYLYHQGTNFETYSYLGVHETAGEDGTFVYSFRVWAPNAVRVQVVGEFPNREDGWHNGIDMVRTTEGGVWETVFSSTKSLAGTLYKFAVTGRDGTTWLKADPYAFHNETLEHTASIITSPSAYRWHDAEWLKKRRSTVCPAQRGFKPKVSHFYSAPMNIYEVHLGSWKTRDGACNKDGEHYLNYRTLADELSAYLKDMGYTHIELLPVMEHPFDGSWGYQVTGYYSPTSRYGTPDDFRYFVDKMHDNDIGVILDWVPAHFPKDRHGLYEFDGQPLYEYQGRDRMEHEVWGTRFFDLGRPEVQSFLVSNALFWLKEYHVDGLRVDAVASMLYLDFDRRPGEWVPNVHGNNQNLEAIAFFKKLNQAVRDNFPDALMIAEESSDWPMITKPVSDGGLGFSFKWNMGWANDMFSYVETDPIYRRHIHNKLTFPMMYAFNEQYILPVSHDEVVHGKKSLIDKMFGEYDDKFGGMRTFMVYMMTLPGKKLTFMGSEYAQFREWDYENQLEWFMTDYPRHREMQKFFRELNHLYKNKPALWEIDDSWDGFTWIEPNDADRNIISYRRRDKKGKEIFVVLNFSPVVHENYRLTVPKMGRYEEILNTDRYEFGGRNHINPEPMRTVAVQGEGGERRLELNLTIPPSGGIILEKMANGKE
ncbi:MAG: 1,4-alpha-glucan branching protein GlgB [Ruminococcaceae bacterium]|nr:1,4-alpha-glucan branching protein GlgB [Oscillospiraceae bacterium]